MQLIHTNPVISLACRFIVASASASGAWEYVLINWLHFVLCSGDLRGVWRRCLNGFRSRRKEHGSVWGRCYSYTAISQCAVSSIIISLLQRNLTQSILMQVATECLHVYFSRSLARPASRCRRWAYVLLMLLSFFNVAPLIRQWVDGSRRGLLR